MEKNTQWIPIAGIIAIIAGAIVFGAFRYHQDHSYQPGSTNGGGGQQLSGPSGNGSTGGITPGPAQPQQNPPLTPKCFTASQSAKEEGQSGCVQFVGYEYTSYSGQMYLDQSTSPPYGFSVYIPAGTSFVPELLNEYSGKDIDVNGYIQNYYGEPEIEVTAASQITLAQ